MGKPWSAIAVGSFVAAYYIYWSSSWQDGNDYARGTTRVRQSAPQITVPKPAPEPTPVPVPTDNTAEQQAARQEAARQEAARQEAARQEAARQEAARQEAARQQAAAAKEMARIKEVKMTAAAKERADAAKRRADAIEAARIQNAKARAAYEAAVAAAAPQVQTNYLITLQNPVEVSILIGILNKTGKMHIRESRTKKVVLSTGPWGNNIKPKSSNNDGYVDVLDLLKLPINPREVDKVNRKMLEAGMDEYGSGYKLTFTDRSTKKVLLELDLGSPTSVTDVPVDRPNSEINDIGRNIRYSAKVVSYQA